MEVFASVLIFTAGLFFGLFFNIVIYRLPEGKKILASMPTCVSCGIAFRAKDLIPVLGYILLKGKCSYCGSSISPRCPAVEIITGLVFTVLYLKFGFSAEFFITVYLMSILLIVFFIDLEYMIIPNELVLAGIVGGIVLFILRFTFNDRLLGNAPWYSPLIGMMVPSGFLLLISLIGTAVYRTDGFGMGDVKIFMPVGLILGFRLALISLVFSVFAGGIAGFILMATGLKHRKSQVPFGPFIAVGTLLSILFGDIVAAWYIGIS